MKQVKLSDGDTETSSREVAFEVVSAKVLYVTVNMSPQL